jgi:hypothetical protein
MTLGPVYTLFSHVARGRTRPTTHLKATALLRVLAPYKRVVRFLLLVDARALQVAEPCSASIGFSNARLKNTQTEELLVGVTQDMFVLRKLFEECFPGNRVVDDRQFDGDSKSGVA